MGAGRYEHLKVRIDACVNHIRAMSIVGGGKREEGVEEGLAGVTMDVKEDTLAGTLTISFGESRCRVVGGSMISRSSRARAASHVGLPLGAREFRRQDSRRPCLCASAAQGGYRGRGVRERAR